MGQHDLPVMGDRGQQVRSGTATGARAPHALAVDGHPRQPPTGLTVTGLTVTGLPSPSSVAGVPMSAWVARVVACVVA